MVLPIRDVGVIVGTGASAFADPVPTSKVAGNAKATATRATKQRRFRIVGPHDARRDAVENGIEVVLTIQFGLRGPVQGRIAARAIPGVHAVAARTADQLVDLQVDPLGRTLPRDERLEGGWVLFPL